MAIKKIFKSLESHIFLIANIGNASQVSLWSEIQKNKRIGLYRSWHTPHGHAVLHSRVSSPQELRVEALALQLQLVASHRRDRWLDAAAGHGTRSEEAIFKQYYWWEDAN